MLDEKKYRKEFAIGDIHGEEHLLTRLMEFIVEKEQVFDPEQDLLVQMGDFVDRGIDSAKTVTMLKKYHEDGVMKVIRGNHEEFFYKAFRAKRFGDMRETLMTWTMDCNGGKDTMWSYEKLPNWKDLVNEHLDWIETLPYWYETEKFFYAHAPIPRTFPVYDLVKALPDVLTWSGPYNTGETESAFASRLPGKVGVCGHIHGLPGSKKLPRGYEHYIYTDAGSGCMRDGSGMLFAVDVTNRLYYSCDGATFSEDDLFKLNGDYHSYKHSRY